MTEEKPTSESTRCFCCGAGPQATAFAEHLWSRATRDHFRNARVEFLKGIRSLIDDRIDKLSKMATKGSTITVE